MTETEPSAPLPEDVPDLDLRAQVIDALAATEHAAAWSDMPTNEAIYGPLADAVVALVSPMVAQRAEFLDIARRRIAQVDEARAALAAATERATRAEAEVARLRLSVINLRADTLQAEEREDQARAQVAKVREVHFRRAHGAGPGMDFVHFGQTEFPDLCDHCRTAYPCPTIAALGPVGATEGEAGCNCGWGGTHDPDNPRCDLNAPASPTAAEASDV